jgi:alkaline phosphatase
MFKLSPIAFALSSTLFFAASSHAENVVENPKFWLESGAATLKDSVKLKANSGNAKNVIIFVGDGMGISTITAARIFEGQNKPNNRGGEENSLSFEKMPYLALSKTYSVNQQTSDSAPTMAAIISGVKTNDGELSVGADVKRQEKDGAIVKANSVKTLLEQAEEKGLSTGIVTTARLTHATPAACYAHTSDRDWESDADMPADATVSDIAKQFVEFKYGNGLEVAMGGGRSYFLPSTTTDPEESSKKGKRKDNRDLTQEWLAKYPTKSAYVFDQKGFDEVDAKSTDKLLGLFDMSHMEYEADRAKDTGGEPSLTQMTEKAIDILSKNNKGYVLMVEAGRIDHAHHAGNASRALTDTVELSNAVRKALEKTNVKDTLIVVTADHSHTFTIAGYPERGNPILGLVKEPGKNVYSKDSNGLPYTTLGYANGPGFRKDGRVDLTTVDTAHPDFLQEATIPLGSETHAAEDVAIFASGPKSHLFHGIQEQSYIYQVMASALKFKAGQ